MKRIGIIIGFILLKGNISAQDSERIMQQMFVQIEHIHSISFTITAKERFFDQYKTDKAFFKRAYYPDAIYYKQVVPPTNAEVLINDKYKNAALVNPNGFPYINLHLSPYGELLRDKQHHTIYQAGYAYFYEILLYLKNKYNVLWRDVTTIEKDVSISENDCYKVVIKNKNYKIIDYKVKNETTPQQLALQLNISDYKIVELNSFIKNIFHKINAGTSLKIPSDYASSIILYVDKELMIPRIIEVYDEKGLFEKYLFEDIHINPPFTKEDFDENNKEYGFK